MVLKQYFEKVMEELDLKNNTGYNGIKTCKIALQYFKNY